MPQALKITPEDDIIYDHPVYSSPSEIQIVRLPTGERIELTDIDFQTIVVPMADFDTALTNWQALWGKKPGKANKEFVREFPLESLIELAAIGRGVVGPYLTLFMSNPQIAIVDEGFEVEDR